MNVVYWSLTTEVHFYVLAPLVAVAFRFLGARATVVGCLTAAVAWQMFTPGGLPQSLVFGRVDQFVLGASLATVVAGWERGERTRLTRFVRLPHMGVALGLTLIALGVWQGAILDQSVKVGSALIHPLVGLVMAAILLRLLTSERATFLENGWLRLAGLVSYGVYLFHYPILEYGYRWLGMSANDPGSAWMAIGATLALTLLSFVVGGLSYVLIERPFLRKKSGTATAKAQAPVEGPRLEPVAA